MIFEEENSACSDSGVVFICGHDDGSLELSFFWSHGQNSGWGCGDGSGNFLGRNEAEMENEYKNDLGDGAGSIDGFGL